MTTQWNPVLAGVHEKRILGSTELPMSEMARGGHNDVDIAADRVDFATVRVHTLEVMTRPLVTGALAQPSVTLEAGSGIAAPSKHPPGASRGILFRGSVGG